MVDFEDRWNNVLGLMLERFGKVPDMEGILFLVGINELGMFPPDYKFTKEQKQDLMHIAVCSLLSQKGYFSLVGRDEEGWPHYEEVATVKAEGLMGQERLLKECIIEYFGS
jgi:hypothetical protein